MKYKKPHLYKLPLKEHFTTNSDRWGACFLPVFLLVRRYFGADRGNGFVRFAYLADVLISIGTTNC
jgi:hypothetical protein